MDQVSQLLLPNLTSFTLALHYKPNKYFVYRKEHSKGEQLKLESWSLDLYLYRLVSGRTLDFNPSAYSISHS